MDKGTHRVNNHRETHESKDLTYSLGDIIKNLNAGQESGTKDDKESDNSVEEINNIKILEPQSIENDGDLGKGEIKKVDDDMSSKRFELINAATGYRITPDTFKTTERCRENCWEYISGYCTNLRCNAYECVDYRGKFEEREPDIKLADNRFNSGEQTKLEEIIEAYAKRKKRVEEKYLQQDSAMKKQNNVEYRPIKEEHEVSLRERVSAQTRVIIPSGKASEIVETQSIVEMINCEILKNERIEIFDGERSAIGCVFSAEIVGGSIIMKISTHGILSKHNLEEVLDKKIAFVNKDLQCTVFDSLESIRESSVIAERKAKIYPEFFDYLNTKKVLCDIGEIGQYLTPQQEKDYLADENIQINMRLEEILQSIICEDGMDDFEAIRNILDKENEALIKEKGRIIQQEINKELSTILIKHLNKYKFDGLVHVTEYPNFVKVMNKGILESRLALQDSGELEDIVDKAEKGVIDKTIDKVKRCTRFYYRFNTPSHVTAPYEHPVGFVFSKELLCSEDARFYPISAAYMTENLDFDDIKVAMSYCWGMVFGEGNFYGDEDIKVHRDMDFCMARAVPIDYIEKIYFMRKDDMEQAKKELGQLLEPYKLIYDPYKFMKYNRSNYKLELRI